MRYCFSAWARSALNRNFADSGDRGFMGDDYQAVSRFVGLLKNTRLSPGSKNMLEYILYQINLMMLRGESSTIESSGLPWSISEIEELSRLLLAAGSGCDGSEAAGKELAEKLFEMVYPVHTIDEQLDPNRNGGHLAA